MLVTNQSAMLLKTRLFTICMFSLCIVNGFSQSTPKDSLENLLSTSTGKQKLAILFELSDLTSNTSDGLKYAEEAVGVAKKINGNSLVDAYDNLGFVYYSQYQDIQAIACFKKALGLSDQINYRKGTLNALKNMAHIYYYIDSLEQSKNYSDQLLRKAIEFDSVRFHAHALYQLGLIQKSYGNTDSALILMNQTLELSQEIDDKKEIALVYNQLGQYYYTTADYGKSKDYYIKEIQIKEGLNDLQGLAIACYNFGNTLTSIGSYQQALEQFQRALTIFEKIDGQEEIAVSCTGIGMVYENLSQSVLAIKENQTNYSKALDYHQRALQIFKDLGMKDAQGSSLQNIANVHSRLTTNQLVVQYGEEWEDSLSRLSSKAILNTFSTALDYYNQALSIFTETKNEGEIAKVYINLGTTYSWARNWNRADKFLNDGLRLARKVNLPYDISAALYALGESNLMQGKANIAEEQFLECAKLSKELGLKETLRYCYDKLSKLYEQKGNIAKAFVYHKMAVKIKDEIFSEKSQKIITEMQTKYETEKKEQEIKLLSNEKALQDVTIQRQRLMIIGAIIGVILILMVALLMFKMFRDKQKANQILEEKNNLITQQKQEITDSIKYASRIQRAVLPSYDLINGALPEHFVLFMPRDIVSGDFYWMTSKNDRVVLVAADCTGHGVPGAFMSMLGVSFLYEIVNKESILQPATILNQLRSHIKTTLSQTGKLDEQKDGMDISICVINRQGMKMEWSGAYNPLYQIRKGELTEYKPDKMPVAVHINDYISFTNHEVDIQQGDTFYMFSDGYADQFGGSEGRKFMSKKFKELLTSIFDKPMNEQRDMLQSAHLSWKGDQEQVDDILVVGFRI